MSFTARPPAAALHPWLVVHPEAARSQLTGARVPAACCSVRLTFQVDSIVNNSLVCGAYWQQSAPAQSGPPNAAYRCAAPRSSLRHPLQAAVSMHQWRPASSSHVIVSTEVPSPFMIHFLSPRPCTSITGHRVALRSIVEAAAAALRGPQEWNTTESLTTLCTNPRGTTEVRKRLRASVTAAVLPVRRG